MSSNGRLTASELTVVQGSITLSNITAVAWRALERAVLEATGVDLVISPNGGYRSYETQEKLSGKGNHKYTPGNSVHGFGTCVDIANWALVGTARLDVFAKRYGFKRTLDGVAGRLNEPWHYQYVGATTAGVDPTPIPKEEDMLVLRSKTRGEWLVGPGFAHHLTPEEATQVATLSYTRKDCGDNDRAFDLLKTAHTVNTAVPIQAFTLGEFTFAGKGKLE